MQASLSVLGLSQIIGIGGAIASLWIAEQVIPGFRLYGWGLGGLAASLWGVSFLYNLILLPLVIQRVLNYWVQRLTQVFTLGSADLATPSKPRIWKTVLLAGAIAIPAFILNVAVIWGISRVSSAISVDTWQASFWITLLFLWLTSTLNALCIPALLSTSRAGLFSGVLALVNQLARFCLMPVALMLTARVFPQMIQMDSWQTAVMASALFLMVNHAVKTIGTLFQRAEGDTLSKVNLLAIALLGLSIFAILPSFLWIANRLLDGLRIQGYLSHLIVTLILVTAASSLKELEETQVEQ